MSDPLFTAMTRPAMMLGVSYSGLMVNFMITLCVFIGANTFKAFLIFPLIHIPMIIICWSEPRFFELLVTWFKTRGAAKNKYFHKKSTYTP